MHTQEPSRQRIIGWLDDHGACYEAQEWLANRPDGESIHDTLLAAPHGYQEWLLGVLPYALLTPYRDQCTAAQAAYDAIRESARVAYMAIHEPAYAAYMALRESACAAYEAIREPAYAAYRADGPDDAYTAYMAIRESAYAAYEATREPAYDAYVVIRESAYAAYEAIREPARDAYHDAKRAVLVYTLTSDAAIAWLVAAVNGEEGDLPCAM